MPRFFRLIVLGLSLVALSTIGHPLMAQEPDDSNQVSDESVSHEWIIEQIHQLKHENYRTRQKARLGLESHPAQSMEVIRSSIGQVDSVVGVQLVDILSGLAVHNDLHIATMATEILASLASDVTSVGRAASNSMSAIADLQEEKAEEILRGFGAYIGPQNFNVNGRVLTDLSGRPKSLRIDEHFFGTDSDVQWIRYLRSVRVVYLNGPKITPKVIESISSLKMLTAIKLRGVALTAQQLLLFQEMTSLEHLGLSYMDVDDTFVPSIIQLPISQSIRLYGTNITADGQKQLEQQFDGLEVFRGAGGFLGVATIPKPVRVSQVTDGSAAHRAGIQIEDEILAINQVPIESFDELRNELGKSKAGETVEIRVKRTTMRDLRNRWSDLDKHQNEPGVHEMTLKATLQEESD